MERRNFIKGLLAAITAAAIPIPFELQKKAEAFVSTGEFATEYNVIAAELEGISGQIHKLFERDDKFFKEIERHQGVLVSARDMRVQLIIKPGKF